jgi:hypothetical protein
MTWFDNAELQSKMIKDASGLRTEVIVTIWEWNPDTNVQTEEKIIYRIYWKKYGDKLGISRIRVEEFVDGVLTATDRWLVDETAVTRP